MSETKAPGRRAVAHLLVRHLLGFVLNFGGSVFLASRLGPDLWGVYSIAYVVQFIAQGLIERGTVGYLIQRAGDLAKPFLGAILLVQVVLGAAASVLVVLIASPLAVWFEAPPLLLLLVAVAPSVFCYAVRAVPMAALERALDFRRVAIVEVVDIAAFNALAVAAVASGESVVGLMLGILGRALASLAVAWIISGARPVLAASLPALGEFARFALPYTAAQLFGYSNVAAPLVLVGTFAGTRELGILQLAYTLILYPQTLTGIFGRVAFPLFSRMGTDRRLQASVGDSTVAVIRYVGGITIVIAVTSPVWIGPLYGAEWLPMSPILLTLAPVIGLFPSLVFVISAITARGLVAGHFRVSLAFSALYWFVGLLLVPSFGAMGLALAHVVAYVAFLGYLRLYRFAVGTLPLRPVLLQYVAACVLTVAVSPFLAG